MKSGCDGKQVKTKRTVELPVLEMPLVNKGEIRPSKTSRWRATALIALTLLMIAHVIQWRIMGTTVSPIEPSETMYTLQEGAINAGFIFFTLAILATLIFGRYVCGWGCHIVALQDFCAWLLKKIGLTPRPFRSRLLIYVPIIVAFYMFVWPTLYKFLVKSPDEPLIPPFTNHLVTTDFWATFPTVAVAIPFLFICGFVTVYFLGSKGFCTYACPYGGVFVLADKFAPGKIRVTDDCNQCGHCTATCMANVQVHAEVAQYGMVIDPGCMKHMDCISVCPNDALYFGFGKPTLAAARVPVAAKNPSPPRSYSLTWPEELAAATVFLASFLAVWDVYQLVPMLMALGIAAVTTFLAVKTWKLLLTSDSAFYRSSLRLSGRIQPAGWAFLAFAIIWIGLNAHSGWIRYHERAGAIAFSSLQIPDELALARSDPGQWLTAADRENVTEGKRHFATAASAALFENAESLPKVAWFEYLSGNADKAIEVLGHAAASQHGRGRALSWYYRGAILNRLGRHGEALAGLDHALAERPDLVGAAEERGESLWLLGRRHEAVQAWSDALTANPQLPVAANMLAGALAALGRPESAAYERQADQITPPDARFHWMLAMRLRNVGMNQLAEKHFSRAAQLNPALLLRRN